MLSSLKLNPKSGAIFKTITSFWVPSGFLVLFLIMLTSVASAQENPTYYKWFGEYRTRFEFLSPPSGESSDSLSVFSHRFILGSVFKPQEDIDLKASLLISQNLGQDFVGYGGYTKTNSTNDSFFVYELYANWLASSGLGFQAGRFLFNAGNDNFFSQNLDDPLPTRFDGGVLKN